MASSRLLFAVLLAASVAVVLSAKVPKDLIVGSRIPGDHLLQREFLKVPSKILQVVKERKTYTGDNYSKITQVRLLDQNKNGNGATAIIVNGGPGLSYVTVDFKSVRGHSIDFIIEIYGR
ncbi:probable salivary secreted peptide [Nasonia vitripennis]|uniref:Salivary secreted peptide n=1 Tax=Nasonia vitripennis TaxID=7425 RepID=A0A7M7GCU8_NASVI|nr:probable salivary secreted peptide [Nasonia vitripennis]